MSTTASGFEREASGGVGCCGGGTASPVEGERVPESDEAVRHMVREAYGQAARGQTGCCGSSPVEHHARSIGYGDDDLQAVPDGANLGLGCGNPTALAELRPGQVVLDLGSGAGVDAFIAARKVGPEGRVIGVDMTREMLSRARRLAVELDVHDRVEFRQGIIEALPVADQSVDRVISNCVINLSPDKPAVFREAFRVLKPGGVLAVSDILLTRPLDPDIQSLAALHVGCVAGAMVVEDYIGAIEAAGFTNVSWTRVPAGELLLTASEGALEQAEGLLGDRVQVILDTVFSYKIRAERP